MNGAECKSVYMMDQCAGIEKTYFSLNLVLHNGSFGYDTSICSNRPVVVQSVFREMIAVDRE